MNSTKCCYEHIGDAYGNNTACAQTVARDNLAHGMAKRAGFAKEISKAPTIEQRVRNEDKQNEADVLRA